MLDISQAEGLAAATPDRKRFFPEGIEDQVAEIPVTSNDITGERPLDSSVSTEEELLEEVPVCHSTAEDDVPMAPEELLLKWNDYQSNLVSAFSDLCDSEQLVDVTLACEDRTFQAHKLVLSACSPYFRNLFSHNPCRHPIVFLKDVKSSHVEVLLRFMYHGEISIQQTELMSLLRTAESLQVKGLPHTAALEESESRGCETGRNRTATLSSQAGKQRTDDHDNRQDLSGPVPPVVYHHTVNATSPQASFRTSACASLTRKSQDSVSPECSQHDLQTAHVPGAETYPKNCTQNSTSVGGREYVKTCVTRCQQMPFCSSDMLVTDSEINVMHEDCDLDPGLSAQDSVPGDHEALSYDDIIQKVKKEEEEMDDCTETWSSAEDEESQGLLSSCHVLTKTPDRVTVDIRDPGSATSSRPGATHVDPKQLSPIRLQYYRSSPFVQKTRRKSF